MGEKFALDLRCLMLFVEENCVGMGQNVSPRFWQCPVVNSQVGYLGTQFHKLGKSGS